MNFTTKSLTFSLLFLTFSLYNTAARKLIVLITDDDLIPTSNDAVPDFLNPNPSDSDESDDNPISDPGSWGPVFDPGPGHTQSRNSSKYYAALAKMSAAASGAVAVDEAVREFEALAGEGCGNAQSVLGFLYGSGIGRKRSAAKAWLYHWFAAEDGSLQSMMALAYMYSRQHMYEKAVKLYAVLAEVAVNSILISKDSLIVEPVRIHIGAEENKEALMMLRGEDDDNFQIFEYEAHKGNARSMYKIGLFYYFGLRGLRCDHAKALSWFLKAAERGEPKAMELLGEIYFRGAGVDKNYSEAFKWLQLAAKHLDSAYNLIGYMHVKGYGVENKNHTKAKEYFEKAASGGDAEGYYNLGLMYLKGMGVKRNVNQAFDLFMVAANAGKSKAIYQLAKMFQTGVVLRKNLPKAIALYKLVAERGPWRSFSRWALDSYLKGDIATALLLYLRMAELGYEVAQSNAAWILDKYGERSMCMGESGFCTNTERHNLAHSLWWQASEQGNEEAALLLGDAYYYGRGTERNYDRAVEAYMHAKSHSNAQAIFNLGYMYEHGQGLPYDLHLAKRYYDQALQIDPDAKFPVTLALASLWMRNNYADSFLVHILDSLPDIYPRMIAWIEHVLLEEGNATILALFVCLLTVLYLRQLRHVVVAVNDQPLRH